MVDIDTSDPNYLDCTVAGDLNDGAKMRNLINFASPLSGADRRCGKSMSYLHPSILDNPSQDDVWQLVLNNFEINVHRFLQNSRKEPNTKAFLGLAIIFKPQTAHQ